MWGYVTNMKILTNENYKGLLQLIADQKKEIIYLRAYIDQYKQMIKLHLDPEPLEDFQKVKKQFEDFKNEDIIFPNTDERGLGEPGTPIDFPDLY